MLRAKVCVDVLESEAARLEGVAETLYMFGELSHLQEEYKLARALFLLRDICDEVADVLHSAARGKMCGPDDKGAEE